MTTIKSLKKMYVKLGGSLTDTYADIAGGKAVGTYATIPEMIQACTKKASGGETLPDYTAADNGKFLGVVEGEAAWAEAGGGSSALIVEMTQGETEGTFVSTITFGDVISAMQDGKTVVCKLQGFGVANIISAFEMDGNIECLFAADSDNLMASGTATETFGISFNG
jgi:hypothetical protein